MDVPISSALHVLIDTNVALDLLLARRPWLTEAQPLWEARDTGNLFGYLCASVLTDIFYICRKQAGLGQAQQAVDACLQGFSILDVNRHVLSVARALPGIDFEDNVQMACAQLAGLDLIVTRNVADFAHSPVPAVDPAEVTLRLRIGER